MARFRIYMTIMAVVFALYGVKELREELEDGRSLRANPPDCSMRHHG